MMKRPVRFPRFTLVVAAFSAVALLLPLAAPHSHDVSAAHPRPTCQAFCVQDGWAASSAAPAIISHRLVFVATCRLHPADAPRITLVLRRAAPRAPPVLS